MTQATHAITQLTLAHFRSYHSLDLVVDNRPVVLVGRNGSGKTNILEAISLFSPGRGLRKSPLRDMDNAQSQNSPWVASIQLSSADISHQLGTGRDGESMRDVRIVKINGERIRKQSELCHYLSVQWLTPHMDMLFLDGNTARRKFLDRLVYGFDPEHANRVSAYEHAMRERNALLKQRNFDDSWLSVLESQMAAHAIAIATARADMLSRVMHQMQQAVSRFARSECRLDGLLETWLNQGMSVLDAEGSLKEKYRENRVKDAARGRASDGVHRTRFEVLHMGKNRPAEYCSTGEQKSLLLAIMIHHAKARTHACGQPPILLLDEVVSHLDVDARKELFDALIEGGMQAWMTGTDAADFQGLHGKSTWVNVQDAVAEKVTYTDTNL